MAMNVTAPLYSLDHNALLDSLTDTDDLLIIQDLDGVCMELVSDPLTRRLAPHYLLAARQLHGHFQVLSNGEHIGSRGVNRLVEQAFGSPAECAEQALDLPGLAAGGVQLQDARGQVSHPGVSRQELAFLADVPRQLQSALKQRLSQPPYRLEAQTIERLLASSVLDNPVSPTLNLNTFYHHWREQPACYGQLQKDAAALMQQLLQAAREQGLGDAFFIHYAPNLGRDAQGNERLRPAEPGSAGTTDVQLMLRGAIKEVGVLALLNGHYQRRTGQFPLGADFNVRQAPHDLDALLNMALEHFDPQHMPRLIGVGDTLSSAPGSTPGSWLRGGSDRGFLSLVQRLGKAFGRDNRVLYVDSSRGEVQRPGIDLERLQRQPEAPWLAFNGISDSEDPLQLNHLFTDGPGQYIDFFCQLAERRGGR